jgi:hypothetical protein
MGLHLLGCDLKRFLRGGNGQALQNNPTTTSAASSLPPYYEVVWVMRVK